jgi:magnesium transporter
MARTRLFPIKRQTRPGAAPGTVIAPVAAQRPVIDLIVYGPSKLVELNDASIEDIRRARREHPVAWVNVTGLGDAELINQLAELFALHKLSMEDVMNVHQRPKAEEFEDHIFLVTRMVRDGEGVHTEQMSFFLGGDYLLTLQERAGDCFGGLRERLRGGKGRVQSAGPDYLCYALVDAVIDQYFPVLERYGESLEDLEDDVVSHPAPGNITRLHDMKRELLTLRRSIWPHREMINSLTRDENPLIQGETRVYLRDVYDHTIQLMDIVETYREIASGLVDVHISSVTAKLNEIMKVLTVIATIFIPLSFIASLYGMNFDRAASPWNMPELGWRFGYPFSVFLMGAVAVALLVYFRRKGWLGNGSPR